MGSAQAGSVSWSVQEFRCLQTKILGFDGVPLLVPNEVFHQSGTLTEHTIYVGVVRNSASADLRAKKF